MFGGFTSYPYLRGMMKKLKRITILAVCLLTMGMEMSAQDGMDRSAREVIDDMSTKVSSSPCEKDREYFAQNEEIYEKFWKSQKKFLSLQPRTMDVFHLLGLGCPRSEELSGSWRLFFLCLLGWIDFEDTAGQSRCAPYKNAITPFYLRQC